MPPRWMSLTIIVLWLATTGWMGYRDVWPRLRPGQPPPFNIDLTEEVGGRAINWEVLHKGESIGFATTQVKRLPDRTFNLASTFRFENLTFFLVEIRKIESNYHVTGSGELLSLDTRVTWAVVPKKVGERTADNVLGLEGKVVDGMFVPRLLPFTPDQSPNDPLLELPSVPVSQEGSVLNPMHPLNKLTGLHEGQHWRIPLVDPLAGLAIMKGGGNPSPRYLDADVTAAVLDWQEKRGPVTETTQVRCWRIDYTEPGKRPSARTWVRQSDGVVLQQEATHETLDLVLRRELRKSHFSSP